jgi:hypothetical protein
MENFPGLIAKILLGALLFELCSSCHSSTVSVEANSTRDPVVAPAGTVLRVRLSEALDSRRSRPGDRFIGTLDSPVMVGTTEVLPKGTVVEGHVLSVRGSDRDGQSAGGSNDASLTVTLDSYERGGRSYAIATSTVARVAHPSLSSRTKNTEWNVARISLPAESIIGFTLTSTLAA